MIVKRLIEERNNMTWVRVEPRSCDHVVVKMRRLPEFFWLLGSKAPETVSFFLFYVLDFIIF